MNPLNPINSNRLKYILFCAICLVVIARYSYILKTRYSQKIHTVQCPKNFKKYWFLIDGI